MTSSKKTTNLTPIARNGDRGLNRNGQTRQLPSLYLSRLRTNLVRIEIDDCVDRRVQTLNASNMLLSKFNRRDVIVPQQFKLFHCRLQRDTHKNLNFFDAPKETVRQSHDIGNQTEVRNASIAKPEIAYTKVALKNGPSSLYAR